MMMPFTMILTICISMVLKRNRGFWTLGLVMREQNTKLITLIIANLKSWIQSLAQTDALISSARYVGLAGSGLGGVEVDPQTKIFSHQCGGHLQPVGELDPQPLPRQIERCP